MDGLIRTGFSATPLKCGTLLSPSQPILTSSFWNKLIAGETAINNDTDTYVGVAEIAKKHEIKIE
jgi:hypothetical protein